MTSSPADRSERIAVADDIVLHALRWDGGDEVPFVLVHGLASNARLWDGVATELAAAGHPVLAVDLRGHGRSAGPDHGPDHRPDHRYDMTTITDDLRTVVAASGFERPVLVGQSWGGNVVVEFAARFPGVARAIGGIDGGAIELAHQFPDWDRCVEVLRPPPLAGTPLAQVEALLRETHPSWPESGITGTLASFDVRPDGTVAPWLTLERHLLVLRGLWEHHPSSRFPLVEEPVLFLVATGPGADGAAKLQQVRAATSSLSRCRVEAMAGDHDLHAQHPGRVATALRTLADWPLTATELDRG